jgi:hypothetical protein
MSVRNPIDMPIIGPSNKVPQDDPQWTLNWYAEKVSDKVFTLKPTPGSVLYNRFTVNGGGRGIVSVGGRLFGVRGAFFQELVTDEFGVTTAVVRGTLNTTTGRVGLTFCLPPNGEGQILIVDSTGYVFKLADNSFAEVSDPAFQGGGSQCAFAAGRAIVFKPGTLGWQCSDLYDFTSWSGLNFANLQSIQGEIKSIVANGDLVYLFGTSGFECWEDQGYAGFPFRRVQAGVKIGVQAPASPFLFEQHVYWLGGSEEGNGVVYRMGRGGYPERISDHSIERRIAKVSDASDAFGFCYQSLGHRFYVLTFTSGNLTLCFDASTGYWHERAWREPISGNMFALPFIGVTSHDGNLLALDYRNGDIFRIDDEAYTDNGNPIRRDRILPVIPEEADWQSYFQSVELFGQTGNTPTGARDPQIMLRCSKDRGMTWGQELWQQSGGNGSYESRTRWVGLGAAFGMVFWFSVVANQFVSWRAVRVRAE